MSTTLQVFICLALLYFLLSTLVSISFEWYAHKTQQRGKLLYRSLVDMLYDPANGSYGAFLYSHTQIARLKKDKDTYPQYISGVLFAVALVDCIGQQSVEVNYTHIRDEQGNLLRVEAEEIRESDPFKHFQLEVGKMKYSPPEGSAAYLL